MQLQNVQNKTKHVTFQLFAFVRHKNKNKKPHKDIHRYKFEIQTIKKNLIYKYMKKVISRNIFPKGIKINNIEVYTGEKIIKYVKKKVNEKAKNKKQFII